MSIKIIMGNMFSGKTSELFKRLKRYLVINSKKYTRTSTNIFYVPMIMFISIV